MSVINQVLSDLEKRGASALPGEPAVRAVPAQRNWLKLALLVTAVLVLALVLAMQWRSGAQPRPAEPAPTRMLPEPKSAREYASASTPITIGTSSVAPAPRASSTPTAPVAAASAPEAAREAGKQPADAQRAGVTAPPTMRMSFELSTIPLSSSLRSQAPSTMSGPRSAPGEPAAPATAAGGANADKASAKQAPPPASPSRQQRNMAAPAEARPTIPTSAPAASPSGGVDKQVKQLSVQQQADNEFRKASSQLQQGRSSEALAGYEAALRLDPGHDAARQALVALLLENRRSPDAERVLQEGLSHNPRHGGFAMLLARLQVERDALQAALDTLLKTLPFAGQQADYQAFVAALLQRLNRHQEAVEHYQMALQQSPGSGIWLMGLGISLQALQRNDEARDAYRRALDSRALGAELQEFVRQRLKEL